MFTSYESASVTYEASDGVLTQSILGWRQGGCDIVLSDLLPRLIALHGKQIVGGATVLELGASCGLVGLIAAQFATLVDITDGDEEEVPLIERNVAENAVQASNPKAAFLEWGMENARRARIDGTLRCGSNGYDVILASQVVYVPEAIPLLVETMWELLATDGVILLYNDAVSTTATQRECRQLLDAALSKFNLRWEDVAVTGAAELVLPANLSLPHADAYLLRITRCR